MVTNISAVSIACMCWFTCTEGVQAAWEKLHTGCWKDVDPAWRNAYSLACLLRALVMLSGTCAALPAESPELCSRATLNSQQSRGVSRPGPPQEDAQCVVSTSHGSSQPESILAQPAGLSPGQHQGGLSKGRTDCLGMPASALPSMAACSPADPPALVHTCSSDKQTLEVQAAEAQPMPNGGSSGVPEVGVTIKAAMVELDMGLMMGGAALARSLHAAMVIAEDAWSQSASSFLPGDSHCEQSHQSRRNERWRQKQLQQGSKRKREEPEGGAGGSLGHPMARSEACLHQDGPSNAPAGCSRDEWRGMAVWPHDESKLEEERQRSVPPGAQGRSTAVDICCCITWTSVGCVEHPENAQLLATSAACIRLGVILQAPGRACLCNTSACHLWTAFWRPTWVAEAVDSPVTSQASSAITCKC